MNQQENLTPVPSILQMDPVVFDELSFRREGFQNQKTDTSFNLSMARQVQKISDGHYRVIVRVTVTSPQEYEARVQISGFCSLREDLENKDELLNGNALAILFPYIRSQLTLLTAQPGTTPIVLPAMNIAKMLEESEKKEEPPKR